MTREELRAWVAQTLAAQGLPPTIKDPATLAKLAAMVADSMLAASAGGGADGP